MEMFDPAHPGEIVRIVHDADPEGDVYLPLFEPDRNA